MIGVCYRSVLESVILNIFLDGYILSPFD